MVPVITIVLITTQVAAVLLAATVTVPMDGTTWVALTGVAMEAVLVQAVRTSNIEIIIVQAPVAPIRLQAPKQSGRAAALVVPASIVRAAIATITVRVPMPVAAVLVVLPAVPVHIAQALLVPIVPKELLAVRIKNVMEAEAA